MESSVKMLTALPNVGLKLAEKLVQVGIESEQQLLSVGAESAFARILTVDPDACLCKLYALEGAVQGIRWHSLDAQRKLELKEYFSFAKKTIG